MDERIKDIVDNMKMAKAAVEAVRKEAAKLHRGLEYGFSGAECVEREARRVLLDIIKPDGLEMAVNSLQRDASSK